MIRSYRDLTVCQRSMNLAQCVYAASERFPRSEQYGLRSQMRRAAVSIASNIAEGKALGGLNFSRHLKIAHGSEAELQTQIELSWRLKFLSPDDAKALLAEAAEVGRMLVGLMRSLPRE